MVEDEAARQTSLTTKERLAAWWGPRTFTEWKSEVLASIVVGFAQIPASVAFAALANVPPDVGLHAAWIVGLINALFGGRPGMINGSAGALASVTCNYVVAGSSKGIEELFVSVSLAGLIISIGAAFNIGRFLSLVPATVMIGFCNGLAIVIGSAQLAWFQDPKGKWVEGNVLACSITHCAMSVIVMLLIPKFTKKVPASLLAIVAGFFLEYVLMRGIFEIETVTVGELSEFPKTRALPRLFFLDSVYDLQNITSVRNIISQALTLALVALLESLMTLEVVNDLTCTVGQPNRQVWALGLGNIVAGLFGTMGGNALIELSVMNVQAGGGLRASATFVAFWVLGIVLFAAPVLNFIPAGTLCGIIVVAVLETAQWSSLPAMLAAFLPDALFESLEETEEASARSSTLHWLRGLRIDRYDAFIIVLVTAITAVDNLATAVGCGMFFASLGFAWQAQKPLLILTRSSAEPPTRTYVLEGNLFFASKGRLASAFTPDQDPPVVQIDFGKTRIYDYSALHALHPVLQRYNQKGTKVCILNMRVAAHLHNLLLFDNVSSGVSQAPELSGPGNSAPSSFARGVTPGLPFSRGVSHT